MPGSDTLIPAGILFSFLLALARVSGVVAFLPVPGFRDAPDLAKIALALGVTICLYGSWPAPPAAEPGLPTLAVWLLSEAALGVMMGLFASVLVESFQIGAQSFGLQAGFSYASTIDPGSQADSTILQMLAELLAATLFFVLGLHREVVVLLASSFRTIPPGTFVPSLGSAQAVIHLTSIMFSTGLKIAFPVLALLLLVDVALALLARIQQQLQLSTLAFPAKMLAAIGFFGVTLWVTPSVAETVIRRSLEAIARVVRP